MKLHISPKIMAFLSIILCLTPAALFAQTSYTDITYSPIAVGTPESGTLNLSIEDPYDNEVTGKGYKLNVQADKVYLITAKFTGEDASSEAGFYLLDGDYYVTDDLYTLDQEDTYTAEVTYESDADGSIYILLYDKDGNDLSYTITVEEVPSYKDITYSNITVGGTPQNGTLDAKVIVRYEDYGYAVLNAAGYSFNATANKTYKITVRYTQSESSGMEAGFFILKNSLQGYLEDDMISDFSESEDDAKELTVTGLYKPSTGGNAKILLGYLYGNGLNHTYTVTVDEALPPITLAELLNSPTKIISYNDLPFTDKGTMVNAVNDPDFRDPDEEDHGYYAVAYKITLQAGNHIKIHSSKEGDSYLYLYKADGTEIEYDDDDSEDVNDYDNSRDSYLEFTADEGGDYYIVVTDYSPNKDGRYFLTVWNTGNEPANDYPTTPIIAKVPKANTNMLKASVQNGTLHLSGLTAGKTWSIYTVSGALVQNGIASGTEANLRLNASGVYLVKSNGQAIRVINR